MLTNQKAAFDPGIYSGPEAVLPADRDVVVPDEPASAGRLALMVAPVLVLAVAQYPVLVIELSTHRGLHLVYPVCLHVVVAEPAAEVVAAGGERAAALVVAPAASVEMLQRHVIDLSVLLASVKLPLSQMPDTKYWDSEIICCSCQT